MAVAVSKYLNLNVTRLHQGPLQQHGGIAKGVLGLGLGAVQQGQKLGGIGHEPHATATPASGGLDHHRKAQRLGFTGEPAITLVIALVARYARHTRGLHQALGAGLVTHGGDGLGRRTHEHQTCLTAGLCKGRVLGQKTITRVHRIGPGQPGGLQNGGYVQVRLRRQGLANTNRLVGLQHMSRMGVSRGIHRHRAVAQGAGAAHDAQGNLAPVGNQQGVKRRQSGQVVHACGSRFNGRLKAFK